jgi:hypothetical protein
MFNSTSFKPVSFSPTSFAGLGDGPTPSPQPVGYAARKHNATQLDYIMRPAILALLAYASASTIHRPAR